MDKLVCDGSCLYGKCPHKVCIKSMQREKEAKSLNADMDILLDDSDMSGGGSGFGIAVDIGSTTIAAGMYDLASGKLISRAGKINSQAQFGLDVISRIKYASEIKDGTEAMRRAVITDINELISKLTDDASSISRAVVCGNTTMEHLFAGIDPSPMGHLPFEPQSLFGVYRSGIDLGLSIKRAQVYIADCVSAFVGGDTVCAILSSDMLHRSGTSLLVDIGTNGEVALRCGDTLLVTSTAAGPAFEGAEMSRGMAAVSGAISHIGLENGKIDIKVIGGGQAQGLCGSGVLDAMAFMLQTGIIDETGRIDKGTPLAEMIAEKQGDIAVSFAPRAFVTQRDVRRLQTAKAAIAAGVRALCHSAKIELADIDRVFLAGGFGNYMDISSALAIGLLPRELSGRIYGVGNAAAAGAAKALTSEQSFLEQSEIAKKAQHVELASDAYFMEQYVEEMMF